MKLKHNNSADPRAKLFDAEKFDFTLGSEARVDIVSGTAVSYFVDDVKFQRSVGAQVTTYADVTITDVAPDALGAPLVFESKDPDVLTIDAASGVTTFIGDGSARIFVKSPYKTEKIDVQATRELGAVGVEFAANATGSLASHCDSQVDAALVGRNKATHAPMYSDLPGRVRNPNCWLTLAGVDLTCIDAEKPNAVLIGSQYGIQAAHFPDASDQYVDNSNNVYTRTLVATRRLPGTIHAFTGRQDQDVTVVTGQTGPVSSDAFRITADAAGGLVLYDMTQVNIGNVRQVVLYVKDNGSGFASLGVYNRTAESYSLLCDLNLTTGVITSSSTNVNFGAVDAGSGWWKLYLECVVRPNNNDAIEFHIFPNLSGSVAIGDSVLVDSPYQAASTDTMIVKYDSPLPAAITPCKMLPTNLLNHIRNRLPGSLANSPTAGVKTDQEKKALAGNTTFLNVGGVSTPTDPQRLAFYESSIPGDSGSPNFLLINGELAYMQSAAFAGGGGSNSTYDRIPEIQAFINDMGGGDTIQTVDISGFPDYINHNLLPDSGDLASWTRASSVVNTNIASPDGETGAVEVECNVAANSSVRYQWAAGVFDANTDYTFSVRLKDGNKGSARLQVWNVDAAATLGNAEIDLSNGNTSVEIGTVSVEDAGDGWYHLKITCQPAAVANQQIRMIIYIGNSSADVVGDKIVVWQPQANRGNSPMGYQET